ncbi:type VII secretion protein EccB [Saccharopolyspora sp. NPDC002686]|uniref:type VII secretion protein EccB n=1 Tax=Saccharopolyspora sp. NPDC002686 TaxID=3154541 RepID=UPI00331F2B91
MQSRKDQVQAYFFVVGRLVAAVTHGHPDALEQPNKRLRNGIMFGVLAAALLMAVFGVLGLFLPGKNSSWRATGTIVVEKESGAQFVYLDDRLYPVINYSSARLAAGNSGGQVVSVSQESLAGTPVGQPIGIPGAPDSLPTAGTLESGPWTVCVQPGATRPMAKDPVVTLLLGANPGVSTTDEQGLLVSTPDNAVHLVWNGRRHRLPDQLAVDALGYGGVEPVRVSSAWLEPIPAGRDLSVPNTQHAGSPGPVIEGAPSLVGQVYQVHNPAMDEEQFYLVRADGMTPLNRTSAALVFASPTTRAAYPGSPVQAVQVGPTALAGVPVSAGEDLATGFPPAPPEPVVLPTDSQACLRYAPSGAGEMKVTLQLQRNADVNAGSAALAEHVAGSMADRIVLSAGRGVLARNLPAPGSPPGTAYLITDVGTKYPLADEQVVQALGFTAESAVQVPNELLNLLPSGPVLNTAGATQIQTPQP